MTQPSTTGTMLAAAIGHHQAGRLREAEGIYREILQRDPAQAEALHLLGVLAEQVGQPAAGEELILRAIALKPNEARYHSNLGELCRKQNRLPEAHEAYCRAIALDAKFFVARFNDALVLHAMRRLDEASHACQAAMRLQPRMPRGWTMLGTIQREQGQFAEAEDSYRKALEIEPGLADAWIGLGAVQLEQGAHAHAEASSRRGLALAPTSAAAYSNLGAALLRRGALKEAIEAWETAIRLKPGHAQAHWNLANALLLTGDFRRGWQEYEWRWDPANEPMPPRRFFQEPWRGEDLAGKRVLIHTEQGFGDAIQFVRYLPMVAQRQPAEIILECQHELARLFQGIPHVTRLVERFSDPGTFDLHCPLMSLPLAFGTDAHSIPNATPYLFAEPEPAERFKKRLWEMPKVQSSRIRVGLVWAGRPSHWDDKNRSATLGDFAAALSRIPDVAFVSLQTGQAAGQIMGSGFDIIDWTAELHDFADTAALITNLDLIVSVDTAVAHLAGSLGKPVWLLLPRVPDWRWLMARAESPWYPTMRLLRRTGNEWKDVLRQMAEELRAMLAQ